MVARDALADALFEALETADAQAVGRLRAALADYERLHLETARRLPPLCAALFTAIREAAEVCGTENCPGCGCAPGDGVTPGCHHPMGCGYLRAEDSDDGKRW